MLLYLLRPSKYIKYITIYNDSRKLTKPPICSSIILIQLVFLRMATYDPLPQRPMHKSRRLREQEPQQDTPEKVVGSTITPPPLPLRGPHLSLLYGVTHVACHHPQFTAWMLPCFYTFSYCHHYII